ncbi:MAG TPA: hydroxyethylthiazole kinase [Anaerolineae bacterium]
MCINPLADEVAGILERVRRDRPLVHIISNFVTMNDVANATLAIGARPVMAHAVDEVADIVQAARALVLNLGTPTSERVEAMLAAGRAANATGIPIMLDPVGVGASPFRRQSVARLLNAVHPAIVRGNADEIAALSSGTGTMSGVDSILEHEDRPRVVKTLAARYGAVFAATGATDYASDGARLVAVANGTPWLKQITGAGDMLDALIGAASAVEKDSLLAAVSGLTWLGVAAERAASNSGGIGSFRVALFDALGGLDASLVRDRAKIQEEDTRSSHGDS